MCADYVESIYGAKLFSYMASFIIVSFNVVIRFVNIAVINRIGYDKKSEVTTQVM